MIYSAKHKELPRLISEAVKRERDLKSVRIDQKTIIMVPVSIPDDEARAKYRAKLEKSEKINHTKNQ